MAQLIRLRRGTTLLKVDRTIPDSILCSLNCATSTVMAGYRATGPAKDRRVLILGLGLLGLTAIAFARSQGARCVVGLDVNADRVRLATAFGADESYIVSPKAPNLCGDLQANFGPSSFDTVLDFSGSSDALAAALSFGDIGAHFAWLGSVCPSRSVAIDPESLIRKCWHLHGIHNYAPQDLAGAYKFLSDAHRDYPFIDLASHRFSLDQANDAVEAALTSRAIRVSIYPS